MITQPITANLTVMVAPNQTAGAGAGSHIFQIVTDSKDQAANQPCRINFSSAVPPTLADPGNGQTVGGYDPAAMTISPITFDWQNNMIIGGVISGGLGPGTPASTDLAVMSLGVQRIKIYCSAYIAQHLQVKSMESVGSAITIGRGRDCYPNGQPSRLETLMWQGTMDQTLAYPYDTPNPTILERTPFFSSQTGAAINPPVYDPSTGTFSCKTAAYGALVVLYAPFYSMVDIYYGNGTQQCSTAQIQAMQTAWALGAIDQADVPPVRFYAISNRHSAMGLFPRQIWPKGAPSVHTNGNRKEVSRQALTRRIFSDGSSVSAAAGASLPTSSGSGSTVYIDVQDSSAITYQDGTGNQVTDNFMLPSVGNTGTASVSGSLSAQILGTLNQSNGASFLLAGSIGGSVNGSSTMNLGTDVTGGPSYRGGQISGNIYGGISGSVDIDNVVGSGGSHNLDLTGRSTFGGSFSGNIKGSIADSSSPSNTGALSGQVIGSISPTGYLSGTITGIVMAGPVTAHGGAISGTFQGTLGGQIGQSGTIPMVGTFTGITQTQVLNTSGS